MKGLENIKSLGFEIEGNFTTELEYYMLKNYSRGDFREDGSMSTPDSDLYIVEQEWTSPVFRSYDRFKTALAYFHSGNGYYMADRAGLHVHVMGENQANVFSMSFQKKLQDLVTELDPTCYRYRLHDDYCKGHQNARLMSLTSSDKYRIYQQHRRFSTVEFRLFLPCDHKLKIVSAALELINQEMAIEKYESRKAFRLPFGAIETVPELQTINIR